MAQNILTMKLILFSLAVISFLVRSDGFNLSKLSRGSKHTRDNYLQFVEPKDLEQEDILGNILQEQRPAGYRAYAGYGGRNNQWGLGNRGNNWNKEEGMGLLGDQNDDFLTVKIT